MTDRPKRRQVVERGEVTDDRPVLDIRPSPAEEAGDLPVDAIGAAVLPHQEPAIGEAREAAPFPDRQAVAEIHERAGGDRLRQAPDYPGLALRQGLEQAVGGAVEPPVPIEQLLDAGSRRAGAVGRERQRHAGRHLDVRAPRQASPARPRHRQHRHRQREIEIAPHPERGHVADPDHRIEEAPAEPTMGSRVARAQQQLERIAPEAGAGFGECGRAQRTAEAFCRLDVARKVQAAHDDERRADRGEEGLDVGLTVGLLAAACRQCRSIARQELGRRYKGRVPVGEQRLGEAQVDVRGPVEGRPGLQLVRMVGVERRLRVGAEQVHLFDRLRRPGAAKRARPVGRHRDDRHRRVAAFHHRGQQLGGGRAGRGHDGDRQAVASRAPQSEEPCAALVEEREHVGQAARQRVDRLDERRVPPARADAERADAGRQQAVDRRHGEHLIRAHTCHSALTAWILSSTSCHSSS